MTPSRPTPLAADEAFEDHERHRPSPRTLDAALRRLLAACARAERGAREGADAAAQPAFFVALAGRRRAALDVLEDELGIRHCRPKRLGWPALARTLSRAIRYSTATRRERAGYAAQTAIVELAIAACCELLSMSLADAMRRRVQRVHWSLEADRRDLRSLAELG